jgi:hypothetical protein
MTDPKVSEKAMLEKLDLLKQAADAWIEEIGSHKPGGTKDQRELDDAEDALRALIADYFRLRKKVGDWQQDELSKFGKLCLDERDNGEEGK